MKKILTYLTVTFAATTLFLPMMALALSETEPPDISLTADNLVKILNQIKVYFAEAIFVLGIMMMLYAAFLYMTASGDDTRIDKAKKTFVWGIVGIIIAMLAYGIWTAVYSFLDKA